MDDIEIGTWVEDVEKSGSRGVVIAINGGRVQIAYDIPWLRNALWRESVYVQPISKTGLTGGGEKKMKNRR